MTESLFGYSSRKIDHTALYRHILEDKELVDDFGLENWAKSLMSVIVPKKVQWLVQQSANMLLREEHCVLQASNNWIIWREMCFQVTDELSTVSGYPSFHMDAQTLDIFKLLVELQFPSEWGVTPLLLKMFSEVSIPPDSFLLGDEFLQWISNSDVNVEQFMSHEVEYANTWGEGDGVRKRFVFETREGGWRLGFEYAFDREISGYPLVSEYSILMVASSWDNKGPIYEPVHFWEIAYDGWKIGYDEWETKQDTRFQRRMAARARKQSRRKGLRSKMPGAWVH